MSRRLAGFVLAMGLSAGCSNNTSGGLFHTSFSISGLERPDGGPLFVTTPLGWAVEVDAAKIDLGPFYFNIDPPNTTEFRSGVVIVESLQQVTVDTLDPSPVPVTGGVSGQTGTGVAVELDLFPPDTTITDPDVGGPANDASAYLAGVATRGGTRVPFAGWIVIDAALASIDTPLPWIQRVNGAVCDVNFVSNSGALTLQVDPSSWFDGADFSNLLPPGGSDAGPSDAGPYGWTNTSAFQGTVLNQIQATTGVYTFTLTNP